MPGTDPVRTLDKASPVWTTWSTILAVLVAFAIWCMYNNKFPSMAETIAPLTPSTKPLFDWENKPKTIGLILFAVGFLTLVTGWTTSIYALTVEKPLKPLQTDGSLLGLFVLIPVFVFILYKFVTGSQFPRLAVLIMASVAISVAALISSQTQVNA